MSCWTPLTKYHQFLLDNPPKGEGYIHTEIWFPRSNPDICRASGYRDLARTIICWAGLMIRQDPKVHPEPKSKDKLILAIRPVVSGKDGYAFMNARGRHPNGDEFHAAHYMYLGTPKAHFNLDQTAKNLLYGTTKMLKMYNIPASKIHIRRV